MNFFCHFRTTGDGSLFHSCSVGLTGDESLSLHLRCITSIELFQHSSFYADHPMIFDQFLNGRHISENSAFSIMLSQKAFNFFEKGERAEAVVYEAKNCASNCSYSSFVCLLALSSVIGEEIVSYSPMKSDTVQDAYELIFNCTILPRLGCSQSSQPSQIHIFCCASMPCEYI